MNPSLQAFALAFAFALLPRAEAPAGPSVAPPESLSVKGVPAIPEELALSAGRYQNTRSARFLDWDPTGGMLIATRFADTMQVHRVRSAMGARTQLTFYSDPVSWATPRPGSGRPGFLFGKDDGGSEAYQLYWFDPRTSSVTLLTDGRSRNVAAVWSNKGDRFVFSSTRRNDKDYDLYLMSPETAGQARLLLETQGHWIATDWSPDDSRLLLIQRISNRESHLHVLDPASGKTSELMPYAGRAINRRDAEWSKDGASVYFLSDEWGEFVELGRLDLETGKRDRLSQRIPWDVEGMDLSADGRLLAFSTNEEGVSRLRVLRTRDHGPARIPAPPMGEASNLRFSPDSKRLAFALATPRSAGDVFVLDIRAGEWVRWTESELGGLDPSGFVEPELIRYPTFDQADGKARTIPAWLYRPPGGPAGPWPVLIFVHGGPEGQERPSFSSQFQYWVKELGLAVLAPNVRGSEGYGKTYMDLDNEFKREDSVKDIGALLDWIAGRPELDSSRVGVYGGSYGGYMALACMARFPERLKAGVDSVGISNFVTFLEKTKAYRRDLRRAEYGDERLHEMRAFLQAVSPTTLAGSIKGALLVSQGLNDPRVPVQEAEQIVSAVEKNGAPVWYILGKDEGHGFSKKRNMDYFRDAVSLFLQKHLIGE
ncbi:MAG: S9 family peptidase [Elusimicrobia bacterium]|nr:S9 family peptidase [Elusimicrobiota bacterium]